MRRFIFMSLLAIPVVIIAVTNMTTYAQDPAEPPAVLPNAPTKQVHEMTELEVAEYIEWLATSFASPADRVAHAAKQSVGEPFRIHASMFDHRQSDCVTFLERTLALGLADSWDSYHKLIVRLRHADIENAFANNVFNIVGNRLVGPSEAAEDLAFSNRNHFVVGEWNRNNAWCLDDITKQLGPGEVKPWIPLHHIMRKKARLAKKNIIFDVPDVKVVDAFIPREAIAEILPELKSGDIVNVIRGTWENRYCDHMGIIVIQEAFQEADGGVFLVHSAPPKVRKQTLLSFLREFKFAQGFKFLRLRADAQSQADHEATLITSKLIVPTPGVN